MQVKLITSDSKVLLDKKIKEIIGKSEVVIKYNMEECSLADILEEASYVSLFDEMKYVVVKNADIFGKKKVSEKETEMLLSFIQNPYPCTTVIFTTYEAIDKRKNITKALEEQQAVVELKAPKNYELLQEVKKQVQNYKIGDASVKYLVEASLGNYDLVMKELEKFPLCFQKGETISLDVLKQIVAPNTTDNLFKFTDAVIKKDLSEAIHLLEEFFSLKVDALQLLNLLAREYRLMYYYKILERLRKSSREIMSELKLQDWQVQKVMRNASGYHQDDLKDYLIELSKIDYGIKSGQSDKNLALYNFLVQNLEY